MCKKKLKGFKRVIWLETSIELDLKKVEKVEKKEGLI